MSVIVLASASPRRRQLLNQLGVPFEVETPSFDEVVDRNTPIATLVSDLAYGKAADVHSRRPNDIVIGADTLVVFNGEYLGKPAGEQSALELLRQLSGQTTSIFTGLAVLGPHGETRKVIEVPTTIKTLSDAELMNYITSGIYKDKAGGVSIEIVDYVEGAIDAVLGLPLRELTQALRAAGVEGLTA